MTRGTFPAKTEEEARSASRARRARVAVAFGVVGAAVLATAAILLLLGAPAFQKPPERPRLTSSAPPLHLDELRLSKHRREGSFEAEPGSAARVIGVGTGRFAAQRGPAARAPAVLDVDGAKGGAINQVASDAEIRRELTALARENARIEAELRGLGGSGNGTGHLIWPVRGPIVSPFGMRWGRLHAGIDIGVPSGTQVHAADSGRVVISGWVGGYGNYVCIQHTRTLTTCYGHNARLGVRRGDRVRQGAVIARSDCTGHCFGPHVHFETRVNGRPVNPLRFL